MIISNPKLKRLVQKYRQIRLLGQTRALLDWDLNVNLPPKAAQERADQSAYLAELVVDRWMEPEFRRLMDQVKNKKTSLNKEEKAIVRNLEEGARYYFNVPKKIIVEFEETSSKAFMSWKKAKEEDRFTNFLPDLKKLIKLSQIVAQHLGFKSNPYDALLNLYEPGLTTKKCRQIFNQLQPELTKILKKIQKSDHYQAKSGLVSGKLSYPKETQRQLTQFVLKRMGYDFASGRMDVSPHPFTTELSRHDVRVTTWYHQSDFRDSLSAAMHEGGHALYEQGVDIIYSSTPLASGVSLGIHESQSRFWENQVGRNPQFLKFLMPTIQAFYPDQLGQVGEERIIRLFNQVKPSLIRVEADEVTYNLHIALRFQLEEGLINDKIRAKDLPDLWRQKMKQFLGIEPKTDREGALQDVHWSYGSFGYFPTYTLGNLYAAQFAKKMEEDLDLDQLVGQGELGTILAWQREKIHQHGSLYWPDELIKRVTGEGLRVKYFLEYLQEKYKKIYDL